MRADSRPSPRSTATAEDSSPGNRTSSPKHRPPTVARDSYTSQLTLTSTVSIVSPRVNHRCIALQPGPQKNATNRYVNESTSAVAVPPTARQSDRSDTPCACPQPANAKVSEVG